ncbi:MAG: DUF1572 domain-containing protein [Planctomycetes bacterium]|nr:DUF1572 domain-containing protein [Planctomycetota bacterium]
MQPTLCQTVAHDLNDELNQALDRLRHCLDQLTDSQVWLRESPEMNSIGNLMLHLAGNVRQWIIAGVGSAKDDRRRQTEFDERTPFPKAELWSKLAGTVAEAKAVLEKVDVAEWQRVRRIQSFEVTGFGAALHSVSHFRGHVQEIIHMTRTILGDGYRFAFVPKTPEQGAPAIA